MLEEVGPRFIEEVEESEDGTYSELSFYNNRYFTHFASYQRIHNTWLM